MLFKKKMDRITTAIQEQQRKDAQRYREELPPDQRSVEGEPLDLTKQDILAIVISAVITFGPVLIILLAAIYFLWRSM